MLTNRFITGSRWKCWDLAGESEPSGGGGLLRSRTRSTLWLWVSWLN